MINNYKMFSSEVLCLSSFRSPNGETFYVGKGKGNSEFSHMRTALVDTG